jgi:hypothetical protein
MKTITNKAIVSMTFGEKSALAHNIAKQLEGNYAMRLKMAWAYIKDMKVATIKALLNPTTENISKAIVEYKGKDSSKKRVKKEKEMISIDEKTFPEIVVPQNILNLFGEDVYATIETLCKQAITGITIGDKHIKGWDALTGEHRDMKIFMVEDGLSALASVETFNELQAIMMSYFLADMTKRMISKYVQMGVYYKKLDERTEGNKMYLFSYENAPSSDEKLAFEVDEVFNELISVSYEKIFSKDMFSKPAFASTSIFFRISNVVRKMRGKATNRIVRELKNNHVEGYSELKTSIYNTMDFLSEEEKYVMEKIVEGYKLKEIDEMSGQRMDRKVKGLRKKLEEVSGLSLKEVKADQKEMIEKQKEAKKEMLERKKEEMEIIPERELGKAVATYKISELANMKHATMEKALNAPNVELIDASDRMKKLFNSKAI